MNTNTKAQIKYMGLVLVIVILSTGYAMVMRFQKAAAGATVDYEEYLFKHQQGATAMQKAYQDTLENAVRAAIEQEYPDYPLVTCPTDIGPDLIDTVDIKYDPPDYLGQQMPSLSTSEITLATSQDGITLTFTPSQEVTWKVGDEQKTIITKSSDWEVFEEYKGPRPC